MKNLLPKQLFIGVVPRMEIELTFSKTPWEPIEFVYPPYSVVKPSPSYLFTLGSGVFTSMATVSANGVLYNSGIDIFRTDYAASNYNEPLINIDHIIASPINNNEYAKDPSISYHWPKLTDEIIKNIPLNWQGAVIDILKQKKT